MANRLTMGEHQSIIALARLGGSYRRIAAEVGVDRETVSRHVTLARGDPPGSNAAISMTGSGGPAPPAPAGRRSRCEPLRAVILAKLEQGLSAQRIWQEAQLPDSPDPVSRVHEIDEVANRLSAVAKHRCGDGAATPRLVTVAGR